MTQNIKITLRIAEKEYIVPITLAVHKAVIPELKDSKLTVVNWVRPVSLIAHSKSERYSEEYWETYKKLLPHMIDIRNNHLSIAESWQRIPDEAIRDENGKIIDFDLAPYEKALQLAEKAGISIATITKMGKDGAVVSSDVLVKICTALECTMDDIVEIVDKTV